MVVSLTVGFSVLTWDAARRVPESVKASIGPNEVLGFELDPLMRGHAMATGVCWVAAFAIGFWLGGAPFRSHAPPKLSEKNLNGETKSRRDPWSG
jgi:hypothetical protein